MRIILNNNTNGHDLDYSTYICIKRYIYIYMRSNHDMKQKDIDINNTLIKMNIS